MSPNRYSSKKRDPMVLAKERANQIEKVMVEAKKSDNKDAIVFALQEFGRVLKESVAEIAKKNSKPETTAKTADVFTKLQTAAPTVAAERNSAPRVKEPASTPGIHVRMLAVARDKNTPRSLASVLRKWLQSEYGLNQAPIRVSPTRANVPYYREPSINRQPSINASTRAIVPYYREPSINAATRAIVPYRQPSVRRGVRNSSQTMGEILQEANNRMAAHTDKSFKDHNQRMFETMMNAERQRLGY